MITFKHFTDDNDPIVTVFEAYEGSMLLGKCLLKCESNKANIFAFSYNSQYPYIADGLIKSAYNFASFKGIYMAEFSAQGFDEIVSNMAFEKVGEVYISDIPTILMGNCCK